MLICDYICSICAYISSNMMLSLCLFSCDLTCDALMTFLTEVFDVLSTEISQISSQLGEVFGGAEVADNFNLEEVADDIK